MVGVAAQIQPEGIDDAIARLSRAVGIFSDGGALDAVGALIESATRRRIGEERIAPDGAPWPDWSESYAKTREDQHQLLVGDGDLLDSIAFYTGANEVSVGSNLVYAAIHQFGGEEVGRPDLPARPYLGLSAGDQGDITSLIADLFGEAAR